MFLHVFTLVTSNELEKVTMAPELLTNADQDNDDDDDECVFGDDDFPS